MKTITHPAGNWLLVILTIIFPLHLAAGQTIYVDANAIGSNNGSSWANAYKYLQNALTVAGSSDSIWVAQGTYKPDRDTSHPSGTGSRIATFQLKNGVAIYGGFPTGGGSRDPNIYKAILSGDINIVDNNSDNSYHVVTGSGTNSSAILDGFTITKGNADSSSGGGMYTSSGSPTINNCTFSGNSASNNGGGMYNYWNSCKPMLTNCTFIGNSAYYGGGMLNNYSSPILSNCVFIGNSATYCGGIYNDSNSTLTNCIFSGNSATWGGGMRNGGGSTTLTNCTFSGNSATGSGGGMENLTSSSSTLNNCIFWGNTAPSYSQIYNGGTITVNYCDVQGGWSGTGNKNADPLFVDANGADNILGTADDNLRLLSGSPCIDDGNNYAVPEGTVADLEGLSRFFNDPATSDTGNGTPPIVDMGAYEYHIIIYVDANATGANNGSSWTNAYKYLQNALNVATSSYDIWVAQGTYRPDEDTGHPDGTNSRTATFQLKNNVSLYGGFPSGGGTWLSRDPNAYQTVLSGDINVVDANYDNSYHVVTGSNTDTAILDGFTITAGYANDAYPLYNGGGMYNYYGSPTVNNCTFIRNWAYRGGGMLNSGSSPTVTNCTFSSNYAANYGGGICNWNYSSSTVTNCSFNGNSSTFGGGLGNYDSSSIVTNCTFSGNSTAGSGGGGGAMFNLSSDSTLTNCTFSGNSSYYGGGMFNNSSNPTLTNCNFSGNSATYSGGGMHNYYKSNSTMTYCAFSGNSATNYGGGMCVNNDCNVTLTNCNFSDNSTSQYGNGMVISYNSILNVKAGGSVSTADEFYFSGTSQIRDTGSIVIGLGGEMIIDSNAIVDMNDPNDPNVTGTIQCDGLLKVKGNGQLKHATVNVSRQAGGYFGKFEVEGSAQAKNLDIHTDGDRFMDVDPCTFTGTIANNRIYVTITEGQNGSTEGILEVRGRELPSHPCDFNEPNVLVCQIDDDNMPSFDTNSWTLERLEIAAGAKVTLMDRFSSGNDDPEVSYVKNLVLGNGCVLNVGLEHLYYMDVNGDSNSIKRDAQLGFSLNVIDCDSNEEFQSRVGNNNYIDPVNPNLNRIQVERVTGLDPDPNGFMKMSNFEDEDGNVIYARAKAKFAPANEDKIRIQFNYLFNTSDPCAQIVVYLSDVPEMLPIDPCDPDFAAHYKYVGCISNPPFPRPGSAGSGRFGDFDMYVEKGVLDLSQGTWVELELIEPASGGLYARGYDKSMHSMDSEEGHASGSIDNWGSSVSCYTCWGKCRDLVWFDCVVNEADFLKVVTGTGTIDSPTCVDGVFSGDGYTDPYDTPSWDWMLKDEERKYLCEQVPLSGGGNFAAGAGQILNLSGLNDLLISGKRGDNDDAIKMKDRLYVFDSNSVCKQYIGLEPNDRCNIRIVRGQGSVLYQINSEKGVLRLDTGEPIVPPGQVPYADNEPRYNQPAEVYAGIGGTDSEPFGRPILDAAFDADANFVYVVPVVVVPNDNIPYAAAAKIQLYPLPRCVVKIYDGNLLPNDNQREYRNSLREIELDSAGNVYVTNANKMNASDILWKFEPNDANQRLELDPCDPCSPRVRAPTGMCVSSATNMLYIASALHCQTDPNLTVIRGFSTATLALARTITVFGMHHVTGITEDPNKALWVTGFNLNSNLAPSPFYDPYLAKVPLGVNDVNALYISGADYDLAMPLSICWTGATQSPPELCGGADLSGNGTVNLKDLAILARHWLNINCGAPNNPCEGADLQPETSPDGDVDFLDLDILADYWLNTDCQ